MPHLEKQEPRPSKATNFKRTGDRVEVDPQAAHWTAIYRRERL